LLVKYKRENTAQTKIFKMIRRAIVILLLCMEFFFGFLQYFLFEFEFDSGVPLEQGWATLLALWAILETS